MSSDRGDATPGLSESFGYDSLNRVTSAIVAGGPAKTFAYDSIGNITTKSDVGTYTYPLPGAARPHAVTEVSGSLNATYGYDANGNLVVRRQRLSSAHRVGVAPQPVKFASGPGRRSGSGPSEADH